MMYLNAGSSKHERVESYAGRRIHSHELRSVRADENAVRARVHDAYALYELYGDGMHCI